jgi:hypothetical protein
MSTLRMNPPPNTQVKRDDIGFLSFTLPLAFKDLKRYLKTTPSDTFPYSLALKRMSLRFTPDL